MSIEKDPIFQWVAIATITTILGAIGVKVRRENRKIVKWFKRMWRMARGNGISLKEHNAAIEDLKKYIDEKTYPIQKDSNGGDSLPDVVRTLERIENRQVEIGDTAMKTLGMLETHINARNAHQ